MLYKVLWEEYERLEILSKKDSEKIEKEKKKAKKDCDLKSEQELAKITDAAQHERESRRQLEMRARYNAQILNKIREIIHGKDPKDKPKALCFSGGGIRSATFNLGILQGLARHGFLDKFDYLSTVSGGGYIGSWLSAWINRTGNVEKVQAALSKDKLFFSFFSVEDFKPICDETDLENSLERLNELKAKLEKRPDLYGKKMIESLSKIALPGEYALEGNSSEIYKLREFAKELTKQLNRIIAKEDAETPLLETRLKEGGYKGKAGKREFFIKKFEGFHCLPIKKEEVLLNETDENLQDKLDEDLQNEREEDSQTSKESFNIEPEEITHLRTFSNYMSPRIGLFSTDTWTLLGVYLRNLLLNWTVFVPFIAAVLLVPKIFVAVLGFEPNDSIKLTALIVSLLAGLIGVCNLNAMRPTLSEVSWVEQNYEVDDIGSVISVESKVFRRGILPLIILAFGMTFYWFWIQGQPMLFPAQFFNPESALIKRIMPFVVFSEIIFVGGFLIARGAILIFGNKGKIPGGWKSFFIELGLSIVCGAIGGALLYLVVNNLRTFSEPFFKFFQIIEFKNGITIGLEPEVIRTSLYVSFGATLVLLVFLLTATVFVGLASRITDDMDREWVARFGGLLLIIIVAWCFVSSLVLFGPALLEILQEKLGVWGKSAIAGVGGISGLITLVLGFSKKSESETDKEPKGKKSFLLWFAPQVAAPIFAVFLMILIVYATSALMDFANIDNGFRQIPFLKDKATLLQFLDVLSWLLILSLIVFVMGRCININKFSLHAAYRERLIRAYLGASRSRERLETANSFTGLDNADNVEMKELIHKPFHVVNMTLNLASSSNLRWQQRKAESFTATALHCGSSNMGGSGNYRSSIAYAYNSQNDKAITLGTCAAISGAAASPNMGYFTSSSAVSFLMALFNIRLGWWLGNTGKRGDDTFNLSAPNFSLRPFIDEAFGRTNDTNPYIYLTDGGHFDNLGLYEMVLRRCNLIVVCDAACDAKFEFFDFGSSIHKIRVDMGIPIEFKKENAPQRGRNCGIARIKYSEVDGADAEDGTLIYIKPTLDGDESIDLINYKKANPDFPHESTADQMYSETQFESYRKLGAHMINSLCCQDKNVPCKKCSQLMDLKTNAEKYLQKHQPKIDFDELLKRREFLSGLFTEEGGNK